MSFIVGKGIRVSIIWVKSSYKINDEFPRINQSSFINSSIPDSISKIRYDIELNKVVNYKFDNEILFNLIAESE